MCNLYSMTRNREAILRLFRIADNRAAAYPPRDAIFPGYQAPIVRKATDGERELVVIAARQLECLMWGDAECSEPQHRG